MNLGEGSVTLDLQVPDLTIFADYGEAEEHFDDIFEADAQAAALDVMGEAWGWGEYTETDPDTNEEVYKGAYSHVAFGY